MADEKETDQLSIGSGGSVFSHCQFTIRPTYGIVVVSHIVTHAVYQRSGYGRAGVSAMLLAGSHLAAELFGSAISVLEVQRDASDPGARLYKNFGMQQGNQGRGHFIMDISTSDAFTTAQELQRLGRSLLNLELQVLRLDWRLNRNKSCAKRAVRGARLLACNISGSVAISDQKRTS